MSRLTRDEIGEPASRDKFSGANADREIYVFLFSLTTCRIGNLTRLIHTLAICVAIHTHYCFIIQKAMIVLSVYQNVSRQHTVLTCVQRPSACLLV